MSYDRDALSIRHGRISVGSRVPVRSRKDLSVVYTPGVAAVSRAVARDRRNVYRYTIKRNSVAVVSDGSAVLGLGNIGPEAAIPVMEGKCLLMKKLAGIDAFPVCLDVHSAGEIVAVCRAISPVFGAVNLEDIAAPVCFEVEARLRKVLDIPVMHDDQHGTAVVVLAGLMNALKVVGKEKEDVRVVVNGCGAAGVAVAEMLVSFGIKDVLVLDSRGIVCRGKRLSAAKKKVAEMTNRGRLRGDLGFALQGADVFIGVSKGNVLSAEMVRSMNERSVVMALANPVPEISFRDAERAGAAVVATGRSDFPNQINNSLAFPGIFRGALDSGAGDISMEMKFAAAGAIAGIVRKPSKRRIVPDPLNKRIVREVSGAVRAACRS